MAKALILLSWLLLCWAGFLLSPGFSHPPEENKTHTVELSSCLAFQVFDGDTFECDLNHDGKIQSPEEHIRLLGLNAPEMHFSAKLKRAAGKEVPDWAFTEDESGAKDALDFLKSQVLHKTVYLQWDKQRLDRYGRSLAFVYLTPSGEAPSLNLQLVQAGLARPLFFPPNFLFQDDIESAYLKALQRPVSHN
ncbi:MAG: thermonuclease family protein [Cyanobacteria bacterium]|nr:thermonuclease family protein [Cyanobacteriota bacterium]